MVYYIWLETMAFMWSLLVIHYSNGEKPWFVFPMMIACIFMMVADSKEDKLKERISELEKKVEDLSK